MRWKCSSCGHDNNERNELCGHCAASRPEHRGSLLEASVALRDYLQGPNCVLPGFDVPDGIWRPFIEAIDAAEIEQVRSDPVPQDVIRERDELREHLASMQSKQDALRGMIDYDGEYADRPFHELVEKLLNCAIQYRTERDVARAALCGMMDQAEANGDSHASGWRTNTSAHAKEMRIAAGLEKPQETSR